MMKPGDRLGSLVLLAEIEPPKFIRRRKERWGLWRCDCGREKKIRMSSVTGGHSRSCGCAAQREVRAWIEAHRAGLVAGKRDKESA